MDNVQFVPYVSLWWYDKGKEVEIFMMKKLPLSELNALRGTVLKLMDHQNRYGPKHLECFTP